MRKLRRAIIEGKLAPGAWLVERRLRDLLGVSRTVVREILRQLEAEGWVVNPPTKGLPSRRSARGRRGRSTRRASLEGYAAMMCAVRAIEEQIDPAGAERRRDGGGAQEGR